MIKLGLAVVEQEDGNLVITSRPYNDRDEGSLEEYEEALLQLPGPIEMEVGDFFKTLRRNTRRMKLKDVRLAISEHSLDRHHA